MFKASWRSARGPRSALQLTAALMVLAVAAGCPRPIDGPAPPSAPPAAVGDAGPRPSTAAAELLVDDERVAWIDPARLSEPTPLARLLPQELRDPTTWFSITAFAGKRDLHIVKPAQSYAGQQAKLVADGAGRLRIGMFRAVRSDLPAHVQELARSPTVQLAGVERVEVRTRPPEAKAPPPEEGASLLIAVAGRPPRSVPVAELAASRGAGRGERDGEGRASGRRRGVPVARLLEGVDLSSASIRLESARGGTLVASGAALEAGKATLELRVNRKGMVVARHTSPDISDEEGELRGVVRVDVLF
jgi:hypothetical protein